MNKTRLKFAGTLALALSTTGLIFAALGQLNVLGNERPATAAPSTAQKNNDSRPKYTFYEDLKRRKTEVDASGKVITQRVEPTLSTEKNTDNNYRYVVQVGAFNRQTDADKVVKRVSNLGYPARVVQRGSKYLAQAGPFTGKQKSLSAQKVLKQKQFPTLLKRLK